MVKPSTSSSPIVTISTGTDPGAAGVVTSGAPYVRGLEEDPAVPLDVEQERVQREPHRADHAADADDAIEVLELVPCRQRPTLCRRGGRPEPEEGGAYPEHLK